MKILTKDNFILLSAEKIFNENKWGYPNQYGVNNIGSNPSPEDVFGRETYENYLEDAHYESND